MDFNQSNNFTNTSDPWDHLNITMENDHTLHAHHHHPLPFNISSSLSSSPSSSQLWPISFPFESHHSTLSISSSSTQFPSSGLLSNDNRTTIDNFLQNKTIMIEDDNDDEPEEELGAMKEMMYKIAAMQPVDIDPATIRKPKRRNVRISDDPQSVAARHRREKISEKIRILQRLVPGGTKMDTASMLDEAVRYVKFLKRQIRLLQSNQNQPTGATVTMATGCIRGDWQSSSATTSNKPLCSIPSSSMIVEPETITGFVPPMSSSSEPGKNLCFDEVINE